MEDIATREQEGKIKSLTVKIVCKNCGKDLERSLNKERINPKRKFCNEICKTRFNARAYYHKMKHDAEFLRKQKIKTKLWWEKNKERHRANCLKRYYRIAKEQQALKALKNDGSINQ